MSKIPRLPLHNPVNPFATMWLLTLDDIKQLSGCFLDTDFISGLNKMFSNPIENVISLKWYPIDVSGASSDIEQPLKIGDKIASAASPSVGNITAKKITEPYLYLREICSFRVERIHNNYLDFSPYTKIELYLPIIGYVALDTNSVMGHEVSIEYAVDLYEGVLSAYIIIDRTYTLDIKQCRISCDMSLGGNNVGEIAKNLIGVGVGAIAGVASIVASGGAATPIIGTIASTSVGTINALQEHLTKQGTNGGAPMLTAPTSVFLTITTVKPRISSNFNHFFGRPLYETRTLSDLTGFTQIETCHLDGFDTATRQELNEIDGLLKQGVIL